MRIYITSFILFFLVNLSAQNNSFEIISQTVHSQLSGNKLTQTNSVIMQINDRLGEENNSVELYYSKGDRVSVEDAYIEDKNGQIIRKLKKSDITDKSAIFDFSLYQDDFVKSFELKHNTYPYRVIYTTKYITSNFLSLYTFYRTEYPVNNIKVIVETDNNSPIVHHAQYIDEPHIEKVNNKSIYTWNFSYKGYKDERNASYKDNEDFPQLKIQPLKFQFGKEGSWESWKSYGNWYYRLNAGRDNLPESEKRIIDNLLKGIETDKEKAKVLYRYLQDNTRYINVSIKYGGLQTYPAEYVCTNRYGDCKALSNYMKAMLKYAGIHSYYTPIYSSDKPLDFDVNFPSQISNHIILTIPFGNDTTFLECTSKNIPFGYVHTDIQGRKALLVDENNSKLIDIPQHTRENVLCTRKINVGLIDDTYVKAEMLITEKGSKYETLNSIYSGHNNTVLKKYITNYILRGSFDIIDYKVEEEDRNNDFLSLAINYKMHNAIKSYGNNIILSSFPINIPMYEKPEERKYDVQIDYPTYQKDTIVYELGKKTIAKAPQSIYFSTPYGEYKQEYYINDNKLYTYKLLLIKAGRYDLSEYESFYKFMVNIKNLENKNIYIETL